MGTSTRWAGIWVVGTLGAIAAGCAGAETMDDGFGPGGGLGPLEGTDGGTETEGGGETLDDGSGDGGACQEGAACEGGTCAGGQCCPAVQACGSACCDDGDVCSFGSCVTPGAACADSDDCGVDQYCEVGLGGEPEPVEPGCAGGEVASGLCLPLPPICEGGEPPGPNGLPTCVQACNVMPDASDLGTVLLHQIDGPGYTAPIVIELDDDDCDGTVSERDIPEIVWNMHTGASYADPNNGRIKAISIVEGAVVEKFTHGPVLPVGQIAAGDIDGNAANGNEVVACASNQAVVALRFDGSVKWTAAPGTCGMQVPGTDFLVSVPNLADLDQDGVPEVITERAILDGATGATEATYSVAPTGTTVVSDLDGDGDLDIATGNQAFDRTGMLLGSTGVSGYHWPAVGDLDLDGVPEVLAARVGNRTLVTWRLVAGAVQMVRPALSLGVAPQPACSAGSAGSTGGGGPPTVGDFDGDGTPDVALAAGNAYVVFDGTALTNPAVADAETVLWSSPTNDCSSAQTGSTLFDFDGNGRVEAVYGDEQQLRIYDGLTGQVLSEHPHPTGTINEYPVVADVDADGQADIVAITRQACGDAACGELRVYGSASGSWVRTRRVWNQYAYHVTNVEEDGSIPAVEPANWAQPGLNNFRQNKQPGGELSAADAAVTLQPGCLGGYSLQATVRNLGQAPLPPGVVVTFHDGPAPGGQVLGELATTVTLQPAQSQVLVLPLPEAPASDEVRATVAADAVECDTANNTDAVDPTCIPAG